MNASRIFRKNSVSVYLDMSQEGDHGEWVVYMTTYGDNAPNPTHGKTFMDQHIHTFYTVDTEAAVSSAEYFFSGAANMLRTLGFQEMVA